MGTYYNKTPIQAYKENGYPNLYLDFAGNKSLKDSITKREDIVTFSRTTEGTYFDADGILRIAATNSIFYSQQFEASNWTKTGITILTNQTTAPDGTLTADKLVAGGEQGLFSNRVYQIGASINLKTVSVYAKAAEAEQIMIRYNNDDNGRYLVFSLIDGSLISSGSNNYDSYITEDVGNGWWRISVTSTPSNQSIAYFAVAGPTGLIGKGIYLWGAQLERGELTYYKPTGASFNSEPRFDHDPVTGESFGLLMENSATKVKGGELSGFNFPLGSWGTGTGISTDISAPDGTSQTYKIVSHGTGTQRSIDFTYFSLSVTSGSYYTCSFYVYATGESVESRTFHGGVSGADIDTNISPTFVSYGIIENGVYTQEKNKNSEPIVFPKNKWVRYVVIFKAGSTCSLSRLGYQVTLRAGAAANDFAYNQANIYIWGVQVEVATSIAFKSMLPSSYIYGTTGTRAQDFATIYGTKFSDIYNESQFSVFLEWRSTRQVCTDGSFRPPTVAYSITNPPGTSRSSAVSEDPNITRCYVNFSTPALPRKKEHSFNNFVHVYNSGSQSHSFSFNGTEGNTQIFSSYPQEIDRICLGKMQGFIGYELEGHIKKFAFWPEVLPSGSLQKITNEGLEGFYNKKSDFISEGLICHLDATNPSSYPGSGATWYDLTGNGNNATLIGSPVYTQSPGFFDIDGPNKYPRLSTTNLQLGKNDFTYSFWMKYDTRMADGCLFDFGSTRLLLRYQYAPPSYIHWYLYSEFADRFKTYYFHYTNTWYNIVFRRKNNILEMFTNNDSMGVNCPYALNITSGNNYLSLMSGMWSSTAWTDGKISTFSIYNRALSDAEIEQNFSALRGRYGV